MHIKYQNHKQVASKITQKSPKLHNNVMHV